MVAAIRRVIILCLVLSATQIPLPGAANETLKWLTPSLVECVRNYHAQGHVIGGDDWDYCTISRESLFYGNDAAPSEPGLQIYLVYVLSQAAAILDESAPEYKVRNALIFCADTYNPEGSWNGYFDRCSSHDGPTLAHHVLDQSIRALVSILNY